MHRLALWRLLFMRLGFLCCIALWGVLFCGAGMLSASPAQPAFVEQALVYRHLKRDSGETSGYTTSSYVRMGWGEDEHIALFVEDQEKSGKVVRSSVLHFRLPDLKAQSIEVHERTLSEIITSSWSTSSSIVSSLQKPKRDLAVKTTEANQQSTYFFEELDTYVRAHFPQLRQGKRSLSVYFPVVLFPSYIPDRFAVVSLEVEPKAELELETAWGRRKVVKLVFAFSSFFLKAILPKSYSQLSYFVDREPPHRIYLIRTADHDYVLENPQYALENPPAATPEPAPHHKTE